MDSGKKRKQERKLTAAEQKRKEMFLEKKAVLEMEGFEARDLTISALYANVMAVVLAFPIILVLWAVFVWKNGYGSMSSLMWLTVLVLFFLLIVVHEVIHGLFWSFFAKNGWKSISFGIMWNSLTPYCTCQEELTKGQYAIGGVMPCVLLGILPAIAAIFLGSLPLFWLGALMILAAGGDLTILWKLFRFPHSKGDVRFLDHPYEAGLVIFERTFSKV
ncbi:DUF3267 domain-containing protein [Anaerotignum sp.]|uniref:DUF3267 domain-containing protein n=1 Tax=Anaerotignum sp. TaxID=2039241 RepID=UPI003736B0F1